MPKFEKGDGRKRPGRPKGIPNKINSDVKAMVLEALSKAGGAGYLYEQAQANPTAFLTLVGKVLPTTIAGDKNNPLTVVIRRLGD